MPKRPPKRPYQPINELTLAGVAATDEALFSSELEALEAEQEYSLKEELKEFEGLWQDERKFF